MKHELTFTNSANESVWADFGYSSEELMAKTALFGLKMMERAERGQASTKTQAFMQTLEEDGEALGIKLDTPTDYFALGALFAAILAADHHAQQEMRARAHPVLRTTAKVAMLIASVIAVSLLITLDSLWLVAACFALLFFVLWAQLGGLSR